jgi:hypothetical protein
MSFSSSTFSRYASKWLIGIGIFEFLLAMVFAAGAMTIPFVGFGFWLTAAILGLTGGVLVAIGLRVRKSADDAERILRTGIDGSATITGLTQTGVSMNDNPQVEIGLSVRLPGKEPYAATRREFVPLILLGRLIPGATLPVTVDPDDPLAVMIDWSGSSTQAAAAAASDPSGVDETLADVHLALAESGLPAAAPFSAAGQAGYTIDQLREVVRSVGIAGTATIDKLADTGETVGDERLFTMQVTLHVPGRADKQLEPSAAMVPLAAVPKVVLGATVPVKVHPENDGLVLFEWERL